MSDIKRKRLFFDIETSPNIGFFWSSGYKINIPFENILKERAIICIAYKYQGYMLDCYDIVKEAQKYIDWSDNVSCEYYPGDGV